MISEPRPEQGRFLCAPWPEAAQIQQPAVTPAQAQTDFDRVYADPEIAQSAGMGKGPPIRPGRWTISYDEALEWIADQQPRPRAARMRLSPQRPDPQAVAMLRQVRKLIDRFNPVVACVVLQIIAAGFECWPPSMIAAASDDQLKEMLEAAGEFLIVRVRQLPDDEPPQPPPADRKPDDLVDRRQELRRGPKVNESRGPPPGAERTRKGAGPTSCPPPSLSTTAKFYAGSPPAAIIPPPWTSLGDALGRLLLRLGYAS